MQDEEGLRKIFESEEQTVKFLKIVLNFFLFFFIVHLHVVGQPSGKFTQKLFIIPSRWHQLKRVSNSLWSTAGGYLLHFDKFPAGVGNPLANS
jgi:hypothetical protein